MTEIRQAVSPAEIEAAREIFREYEKWIGISLCFQDFENELRSLPGKYALPNGRLLLAYIDGEIAGCAAFRKIDENACELKRLFVRGRSQGKGLVKELLAVIIAEARAAGYKFMRLDSMPSKMERAIEMYRSHGFYEIQGADAAPHDLIYMEKRL